MSAQGNRSADDGSNGATLLAALPEKTRAHVRAIYQTLAAQNFECYLVGGAVRDLRLGRAAKDLDFATNARPEQVLRLFKRTVPTGLKHGTVTVLLDDAAYELTTYRSESAYTDGRHPDAVRYADSLAEDLSRRDFTVNALALEPGQGELVDLYDGLRDLNARLLRTIGRPEDRFFEDGLRPVRACRFAATLGFRLESATERALSDPEVQRRTALVAVERFTDELLKGFAAEKVSPMIQLLESSGLLYLFFTGEFARVSRTSAAALDALDSRSRASIDLKLALWWDDLGVNAAANIERLGRQLKLANRRIRNVQWHCSFFQFQREFAARHVGAEATGPGGMAAAYAARFYLSRLKEACREDAADLLEDARLFPEISCSVDNLQTILARDPLTVRDLALSGQDLMQIGLSGQAIGESLRWLLDQTLRDPTLNTREGLLALLPGRPTLET